MLEELERELGPVPDQPLEPFVPHDEKLYLQAAQCYQYAIKLADKNDYLTLFNFYENLILPLFKLKDIKKAEAMKKYIWQFIFFQFLQHVENICIADFE